MVVNHSVKLSFDLCLTRFYLKNCILKKPIFARRKTDLKRDFIPKKAYTYKSPVLARLSDGSGWFPPRFLSVRQLRSIQLRGAISLCALPPIREYAIHKINVWQKNTDNFHACTPALYHIEATLSRKIRTFVCIFLEAAMTKPLLLFANRYIIRIAFLAEYSNVIS